LMASVGYNKASAGAGRDRLPGRPAPIASSGHTHAGLYPHKQRWA
jgi:hypothetical protein